LFTYHQLHLTLPVCKTHPHTRL